MTARLLAAAGLCALLADTAHAQETSTDAGPSDRWRFELAPYVWMISLDGTAGLRRIEADVDVDFSDAVKDLSFGGMLLATARKGRFGLVANGVIIRVSPDKSVGPLDIDTTSDLAQFAAAPFYRVVEWTYAESDEGKPRKLFLEPYVGARWNYLRLEFELRGGRQFDQSEAWVDPIVGTRFGIDLADRVVFAGAADVGGVVTGSDFSWNVQGYLGYRTEVLGKETLLSVGYRALHTDYDRDNFKWDTTQHGPIIGASFRF